MPTVEELRAMIGREAGVSDWVEVTQERIEHYAEASGDRQWIHVDVERARRESPFHATVAPGFLTLGMISDLSRRAFEVLGNFRMRVNYGVNRVRFPSPVVAGTRVRGRFTVFDVKEIPGAVEITLGAVVEKEDGGKPALAAEWVVRYYYAV